jgi:hypothetical protein
MYFRHGVVPTPQHTHTHKRIPLLGLAQQGPRRADWSYVQRYGLHAACFLITATGLHTNLNLTLLTWWIRWAQTQFTILTKLLPMLVVARSKGWSAAARLLRLWVRIQTEAWMFVSCECCVLSDIGLCVGAITRTEESYRMWRVWVWSWILDNEEALVHWGLLHHGKENTKLLPFLN